MQAVREITVWDHSYQPNHQYLLDGNKMVAYIPGNGTVAQYFKTPIVIDKKGRKFAEVSPSPFTKVLVDNRIKVEGSKGAVYLVDLDTKTCNCSGFSFRKTCRHIAMAAAQ